MYRKSFNWARLIGLTIVLSLSSVIFYLAFFVLASFVAGLIPASEWKPLMDFLVYALIAGVGGVGIPLWLLIAGSVLVLQITD
jgi:hypothetical protein